MELSGDINPALNNASLSCVSPTHFHLLSWLPLSILYTDYLISQNNESSVSEFPFGCALMQKCRNSKIRCFHDLSCRLELKLQSPERRHCFRFELFLTKNCLALLQCDYINRYKWFVYFFGTFIPVWPDNEHKGKWGNTLYIKLNYDVILTNQHIYSISESGLFTLLSRFSTFKKFALVLWCLTIKIEQKEKEKNSLCKSQEP